MKDERKWAYGLDEKDFGCGEYDTRKAALAAAREHRRGYTVPGPIYVGRITPIKPEDHVPTCLDTLLERMNERAFDNTSAEHYDTFDCDDEKGAAADLEHIMRAWARKWITAEWWDVEDVEEVDA